MTKPKIKKPKKQKLLWVVHYHRHNDYSGTMYRMEISAYTETQALWLFRNYHNMSCVEYAVIDINAMSL